MILETIALGQARLTVYARDNSPEIDQERRYPAILILPGGGYGMCSDREAEPVALPFPAPDAALRGGRRHGIPVGTRRRVSYRSNACIRVRILGGRAPGGDAGLSVARNPAGGPGPARGRDPLLSGDLRRRVRPPGSFENLTGGDKELTEALSLEKRVDERTAPAFIWTTADDGAVSAMNSILMAQALATQGISYALHIFPQGVHGLSMADEFTAPAGCAAMVNSQAARWFPLAVEWIKQF